MDSTARRLIERTAARCRRRTLVLGRNGAELERAIRARGMDVVLVDPTSSEPSGKFSTVVVNELLEHVGPGEVETVLSSAWSTVSSGGRLIVNVPHEEKGFDRRRLKKALRNFGEPRLATDQPYRVLTMLVEKPGGKPRLRRLWRDRYRSIAKRCRGRTVELGCGRGELSRVIHDRGHEVVGVDMNAKKIEIARANHPDVQFLVSDIRSVELPDGGFDTAVLAEVLEHVSEELGDVLLDKASRLLAPKGRLVVSVPNEDCIPHPNHVREFDRRTLEDLLGVYGRPRLCTDQPFKWLLMFVDKRE